MSYGIWNSDNDFSAIHGRIEELFRNFLFKHQDGSQMDSIWIPPVDICEEGESFILVADLPGVNKEDINILVEKDKLILYGVRSTESGSENNNENYHRIELVYGKFWRAFTLDCGIDRDNIASTLQDGVLTIILPKSNIASSVEIK